MIELATQNELYSVRRQRNQTLAAIVISLSLLLAVVT
jgi:hypothetical protein